MPGESSSLRPLAPYLVFPQDKHFEDQFIMYRVLYSANKVIYENANDYFYTVERACSITHQFDERHLDTLEARFGIIEFARKEGIPSSKRSLFSAITVDS